MFNWNIQDVKCIAWANAQVSRDQCILARMIRNVWIKRPSWYLQRLLVQTFFMLLTICEITGLGFKKWKYFIWLLRLEKLLTLLLWRVQSFRNTRLASIYLSIVRLGTY